MAEKVATNKTFCNTDIIFREACELAGVKPTVRQGSKYRNGKGKAFFSKKNPKAIEV